MPLRPLSAQTYYPTSSVKMAEESPLTQTEHWKQLADSVKDADCVLQEAINAQHDHLIMEIETSDGPLATNLR